MWKMLQIQITIMQKRNCEDFELKNLKSDTLLLGDIFENFGKMCLEINDLDPAKFLSASRLGWQAALKKAK